MTKPSRSRSTPRRLPRGWHGGPAGSGRRCRPGRGPSNPSAGRGRPLEDPTHVQTTLAAAAVVAVLVARWRLRRARRDPSPTPSVEPEPQPSGRRGSELDAQRGPSAGPTASPRHESGRALDRHRDDGHAPHRPRPRSGSSMAGCSSWAAPGDDGETVTSAELYDPISGTWSATGNMLKPHGGFPATLLRDGRVLVGDVDDPAADDAISGAEVYDPASGTWTATGPMVEGGGGTATLLRDGKVLVTGSTAPAAVRPRQRDLDRDREDDHTAPRHAAILLPDGKVLVAGGHVVPDDADGLGRAVRPGHRDPGPRSRTCTPSASPSTPSCCPMARCSWLAGPVGATRSPPSCTTRPPGRGPPPEMASRHAVDTPPTPLADGRVLVTATRRDSGLPPSCTTRAPGPGPPPRPCSGRTEPRPSCCSMARSSWQVAGLFGRCVCCNGLGGAVRPCRRVAAPLPAFPSPPPPVIPSPTPIPTPYPPAAGPVPAGAPDLEGHGRQQEFRARDVVRWPRRTRAASDGCVGP